MIVTISITSGVPEFLVTPDVSISGVPWPTIQVKCLVTLGPYALCNLCACSAWPCNLYTVLAWLLRPCMQAADTPPHSLPPAVFLSDRPAQSLPSLPPHLISKTLKAGFSVCLVVRSCTWAVLTLFTFSLCVLLLLLFSIPTSCRQRAYHWAFSCPSMLASWNAMLPVVIVCPSGPKDMYLVW